MSRSPKRIAFIVSLLFCVMALQTVPAGANVLSAIGFGRAESAVSISPRPSSWAEKLNQPGLPNLHRVSPALYRGAQPRPKDVGFRQLKAMGIRTVVNLRYWHNEREEVRRAGLEYILIKFNSWEEPNDSQVIRFLLLVSDTSQLPIFVHCQHGADRTGTMCAIYRIVIQGWSKDEAIREMTQGNFNFHADYYQSYVSYVENLDVARIKAILARSRRQ